MKKYGVAFIQGTQVVVKNFSCHVYSLIKTLGVTKRLIVFLTFIVALRHTQGDVSLFFTRLRLR